MYLTSKTYTITGTWLCPPGVTSVIITTKYTGGGNAGVGSVFTQDVIPNTSYSVTIDETLETMSFGSFIYQANSPGTNLDCFLTVNWMD